MSGQRLILVLLLLVMTLPGQGVGAEAAGSSPATPLVITSDHLEMDDRRHTALFTGHVEAVEGRMRLTAERMTVHYRKSQPGTRQGQSQHAMIERVVAEGAVVLADDTNRGTGQRAVYQTGSRTLELFGEQPPASILRGEDRLTGGQILLHLAPDGSIQRVQAEGHESQRVSARITPSRKKEPEQEAAGDPPSSP